MSIEEDVRRGLGDGAFRFLPLNPCGLLPRQRIVGHMSYRTLHLHGHQAHRVTFQRYPRGTYSRWVIYLDGEVAQPYAHFLTLGQARAEIERRAEG